MSRLYYIDARMWNKDLEITFGKIGNPHYLSDEQVIEFIMMFGRAAIKPASNPLQVHAHIIEFQNVPDPVMPRLAEKTLHFT